MGYAGYVPAKYASKLTPQQQALKAVANTDAYDLMAKLVRNVVRRLPRMLLLHARCSAWILAHDL